MARRRRTSSAQIFPWRFLHRRLLSFQGFVFFLVALLLLGLAPSILFHLRLKRSLAQNCKWLYSRPLICAHGGDTSRAPPNTFEAYNIAMRSHADCIEIDATRTRDGVLVALHSRDLQNIYSNDYLQVGDLTLDEVNGTQCRNCLVWSKADSIVKELKLLSPDVLAGYIVMRDELTGRVTDPMRIVEGEVVGAYHGLVDSTIVANVHRAGKKLYAWTVNERDTMERMLYEGVDGIVTSHPTLLHNVMLELENHCIQEGFSL